MVRYAAVVVSLLAVLVCARAAEAQYFGRNKVRYDRLDFRVLQTEHFDIYYYAEEEQATRYAARMAEQFAGVARRFQLRDMGAGGRRTHGARLSGEIRPLWPSCGFGRRASCASGAPQTSSPQTSRPSS